MNPKFNVIPPQSAGNKPLGLIELVAIAIGGMIGGGIFTVLGVSVSFIGVWTPVAIIIGGVMAALAAYSYVKLAVYYQDEGATYAFYKRTFPHSHFSASLIGWYVIFGYICTVSLYAYTFSAYALSSCETCANGWPRTLAAIAIISFFALINMWSVRGMGKLEDVLVYAKVVILIIIAFVLFNNSYTSVPKLLAETASPSWLNVFIISSLTFVAFEGFQLVIHATEEIADPQLMIPKAIYTSVLVVTLIYVAIAAAAVLAIPLDDIVSNKEYALAASAEKQLGHWGTDLIVLGAVLATSSAINGTLFGASRLMNVIAGDGYFPRYLTQRTGHIPKAAILTMSALAVVMLLLDGLELILEFASITFLLVSILMAVANFKIRHKTKSSLLLTVSAIAGLSLGALLVLFYEFTRKPAELLFIIGVYVAITLCAWLFARLSHIRFALGGGKSHV